MIIFEIPQIKERFKANRLALIIGSLFPDFLDKPLSILEISSGRGFSHTLIFVFVSFLFLHLATKGNKAISFPFLIGCIFHLLLDLPYVPLFWPFIRYEFPKEDKPIETWMYALFNEPIVIITEIIGIVILLFIFFRNKLYRIEELENKKNEGY